MSAENQNPSSPTGGAPDGAAEPANHAPESVRTGVVASHGEREKRAYVAPVEVPKRHQRTNTIDMSKVRISPDMKVQQLDPRHMPTRKMDIPPGGIRPPPPPANAEIADPLSTSQPGAPVAPGVSGAPVAPVAPGASPWSQNAGIDRSMLPSAAMASAPAPAQRIPSMPPPRSQAPSSIGPGIWIAVILVAALLGGGVALALRSSGSSGSTDAVSSSAPISIAVPTTTNAPAADTANEAEVVETDDPAGDAGPGAATKSTAPRTTTTPRRTSPAPKTTAAPAPAPAPTTTTRPRLFN